LPCRASQSSGTSHGRRRRDIAEASAAEADLAGRPGEREALPGDLADAVRRRRRRTGALQRSAERVPARRRESRMPATWSVLADFHTRSPHTKLRFMAHP